MKPVSGQHQTQKTNKFFSLRDCMRMLVQAVLFALITASSVNALAGLSGDEKKELHRLDQSFQDLPQSDNSAKLTLASILHEGSLANPALKKAFYEWKAAVQQITQARSLEDPQFTFKQFLNEVETRVGPQRQAFAVMQEIPFPGKLYERGKAATAEARQKYADFEKVRLTTVYELKDVFFEYWFLYKKIAVTEKNMELLKHFESVAQSKFKSGLAKNQDLLKAQVELGKLENDLITLHDYELPLKAMLNALLNRDVVSPVGSPEEIAFSLIELDEEDVMQAFEKNNPDLLKAAQRIEKAQNELMLARLDFLPDTTVGYEHIRVDGGHDADALSFRVNVPLWYGKQKSQLEEAKADRQAAMAAQDGVEHDLEAALKMVLFKIKDSERQIKLYRDALVPKAEQMLNASETAYSSGGIDFLYLIDSERTLLEFQLGYYQAIRNYEQRLAELEMMIGQMLTPGNEHQG
ncbi:MAG: TolC family protein [Candidatus Omnitrophica bacterium]|nr:TolC family protein [Candidatus Omnitrophota bacterium]